jgi:regulatory protein
MFRTKQLSKEQALQKLKHYCRYQERCHAEVKEKLYSFGLFKQVVEECISQLIEEDYLNEERFALQFASGKFRIKQWGSQKIKHELKLKRVSEYCIRKALQELDQELYLKTLNKLATKKWNSIKGEGMTKFVKTQKTTVWLMQRGYESDLIRRAIKEITDFPSTPGISES